MRYSQLIEAKATDIAVFYGGRFQPMHSGHFQVYMDLVRKFGSDNVFIATMVGKNASSEKDPFTFDEKKMIMNKMFNIPLNNIINTMPYRPNIAVTGKDPNNTALLVVFSEKDEGRLQPGQYFKTYSDNDELLSSDEAGYIYTVPVKDDGRSATTFRNAMRMPGLEEEEKQKVFKEFFGVFNPQMYQFVLDKLNERK
jgi:nicotinamide mononucleotide adenylyltransferase